MQGLLQQQQCPLHPGFCKGQQQAPEVLSCPAGRAQRGAAPVPLRSSQSRGALMQGWRSIMQGSPEHSSGKSLLAAAAQKGGLDLAWRLNGMFMPHPCRLRARTQNTVPTI